MNSIEYRYFYPFNIRNLIFDLDCVEAALYYYSNVLSSNKYLESFNLYVNDLNVYYDSSKENKHYSFGKIQFLEKKMMKFLDMRISSYNHKKLKLEHPKIVFGDTNLLPSSNNYLKGELYKKLDLNSLEKYHPVLFLQNINNSYIFSDSPYASNKNFNYINNRTIYEVPDEKLFAYFEKGYYELVFDVSKLEKVNAEELLLNVTVDSIIHYENKYNNYLGGRDSLITLFEEINNVQNISDKIIDQWIEIFRNINKRKRVYLYSVNCSRKLVGSINIKILQQLISKWFSLLLVFLKAKKIGELNEQPHKLKELTISILELEDKFRNEVRKIL